MDTPAISRTIVDNPSSEDDVNFIFFTPHFYKYWKWENKLNWKPFISNFQNIEHLQ
jgi:hypothetical protein